MDMALDEVDTPNTPTSAMSSRSSSSVDFMDLHEPMDASMLRQELASRDARIASLRHALKRTGYQLAYLRSQCGGARTQATAIPMLDVRRSRSQRLSVNCGLALGLRKGMSNIGASDVGRLLLVDLSRQTVCRWEVLAGSSIIASSRDFQQEMHEVLVAPTEAGACGDTELRFVLHSIRGDATNVVVLH
jgi:hypothetical protein